MTEGAPFDISWPVTVVHRTHIGVTEDAEVVKEKLAKAFPVSSNSSEANQGNRKKKHKKHASDDFVISGPSGFRHVSHLGYSTGSEPTPPPPSFLASSLPAITPKSESLPSVQKPKPPPFVSPRANPSSWNPKPSAAENPVSYLSPRYSSSEQPGSLRFL
jgi:hypothetical protein